VKNIYLFLLFIFLTACSYNPIKSVKSITTTCPLVLFTQEHKVYIDNSNKNITIDNIEFRAEINNALFNNGCYLKNDIFSSNISLLFIVNPIKTEQKKITLPFYIAILDNDKNIVDIKYYSIDGDIKKDSENQYFVETEMISKNLINSKLINSDSKLLIGFMIDNIKLDILN
jgi:hypothetical protein